MPRIGKSEPSYDPQIVGEYFSRFTFVETIASPKGKSGPPSKDIRINGVEIDSQDKDWDYLKRLEIRKSRVSLRKLDELLCRFSLCLSDFELFYEEKCRRG